ncbi:S-adenosyl-L-methionine-dependent methyltransferase [Leucosporidium creatinivorum]|uniref:S-adenosyl-L-methionine-dependent methyltransferase n=1 Tax=Leucosporidium creatinivorum TaxID=106004 RepID=A0A1Y2ETW8_9BASI|nr:S-adenosyl-L-methionine-dependent methyltransferase [Leucosporidium creatinivorum]
MRTRPGEQDYSIDPAVLPVDPSHRDMYLILRAMGARRVVEAGTSHGVSLLWLLAAVLDNEAVAPPSPSAFPSLVVGTENEPHKAAIALKHVEEGFGSQPPPLNLLQGDLLETLPALALPPRSVDALLLDIWSPLALPTLKIVLPALRIGATVFIDNTVASAERYMELLDFLRAPNSGFDSSTLPHSGGFELCVYTGN